MREMHSSFFFGTEEFVAHTPNVNCLALGHKSGRVLVTGGDDKKVNLWAVGKQNCIMVIVAQQFHYLYPVQDKIQMIYTINVYFYFIFFYFNNMLRERTMNTKLYLKHCY